MPKRPSEARIKELEYEGFVWVEEEQRFHDAYNALLGHEDVPMTLEEVEAELAAWLPEEGNNGLR